MKSGDYILISDIFGIPGEHLVRMFEFSGVSFSRELMAMCCNEHFNLSYDILYIQSSGKICLTHSSVVSQLGNRITRQELDKMLSLTNFSED